MFITTVAIVVALAALIGFSATQKLGRSPETVAAYAAVGVKEDRLAVLALLLIAAAAGLVVGLFVPAVGIAAAAGLVIYFTIALGAHLRHQAMANVATPIVILVLAVGALWLRIATA